MSKNEVKSEKNWFSKHKVLTGIIIVIALIVVGSIAGGGSDTSTKIGDADKSSKNDKSEPEKSSYNVGETIAFDGKEVTVQSVKRNWSTGNEYLQPNSGMEFVKVAVQIVNKSEGEIAYNTFDWKLQDSNGAIKDVDGNTFGTDGALGSGEIAPNGKISGFLIFEVPEADKDLTLRYEPSFWSDKKVEVKL